jgi:acetoin utilization deacetylase AcuC-like enzyme
MIPVFYRSEQSNPNVGSFSPSAGKPARVIRDWKKAFGKRTKTHSFEPVSHSMLYCAHNRRHVHDILRGRKANGFGRFSDDDSFLYTVGSTVAASYHVLQTKDKVAVSPTSGFHHAGYDFSEGFCTFNGLMVAAIQMYRAGLAERILILDMDMHYGNGTQDIIDYFGIDYVDHLTSGDGYQNCRQALSVAANPFNHPKTRGKQYDLVLYQAGADMHIDDPLGGLLNTQQMEARDYLVFKSCKKAGVPLVWNLAGGYQKEANGGIGPVLDIHRNTMQQCLHVYGN